MVFWGPTGMGVLRGRDVYKEKLLRQWHAAFTGYEGHREVLAVDEENGLVTMHGYANCVHTGTFLGVPATGRTVRGSYMDIWRFQDGLLAENWVAFDMVGLLRQIGGLADIDVPVTLAG